MGKGGGGSKIKLKTSPLEQKQVDIAEQQRQMAEQNFANMQSQRSGYFEPMRQLLQPQIMQTLGYASPFATQLTAAERAPIEGQYNRAKEAIMNTAQRGGRLRAQMAGLERDRASAISQASNQARERGINRALGFAQGAMPTYSSLLGEGNLATGGLSAASGGIGSALSSMQQRAMQEAQMKAQAEQSKGSGIGSLIGTGIGAAAMFMSSRDFKEDINPVEFDALELLDQTPVYTWRYKGDNRTHIGPVTEEAPAIIVTEDGKALVPIDYLGFLFAAVKQLSAKVSQMEQRA